MKDLKWNPIGLVCALALGGMFMFIIDGCEAYGGNVRRVCHVQRIVAAPYVAPSLAYAPAVQYYIGQQVRQQSVDTYSFRASDEYQEYQQLKIWRAGFEEGKLLRTPEQPSVEPLPAEPAAEQLPAVTPEAGPPQGPPPTPAQPTAFAHKIPTLVAHCGRCHTGDEPKGDRWIDGTVDLTLPDSADKRDAIVRNLLSGHMPPSGQKPVDDDTFGKILYELYPTEEPEPK